MQAFPKLQFSSRQRSPHRVCLGILFAGLLPCQAWQSSLYPTNWMPPETASFTTDKLIQDFSYAGYRRGENPIPAVVGPVFNAVSQHGADPSGRNDSTAAIQAAINAAASAGGGVVFLPAGTYRVVPKAGDNFALWIKNANIVLRGAGVGQTFLLNTSYGMRGKNVIRVAPPSTWLGSVVNITANLDRPTRRIPVANASAFKAGDQVRIEWNFTQGWIDEHSQGLWWSAPATIPAPAHYLREVVAVNTTQNWIEVDVPTRYTMKTRDSANVRTIGGRLSGVGIENLSIGNVQHPGSGWGEEDYNISGTAAYDAHASWLILLQDTSDSWIRQVESFQAAGNTSTCHMLSNGISLVRSSRVTVANTVMRRSQYGGGGGNGYMFRIQSSNENLIQDCIADFSRHGLVISHAGTSGNVFLRCEDRETQRSTGSSGSYTTIGSGCDHHMHFSHSNLFDKCHAHNSFYTAEHRREFGGAPGHALTSAHGVYWNISGSGERGGAVARSEQGRYGYVIGTSGSRNGATNNTAGNTAPADHLERIGEGATLEPQSLYLDQLSKREQGILLFMDEDATVPPSSAYPLNATTHIYGSGPVSYTWSQRSGPVAVFADATSLQTTVALLHNGTYVFELTAENSSKSATGQITITVLDPALTTAPLASADTILGRRQQNANPLGYYVNDNGNTIGVIGSDVSKTRRDLNVVYRYELPTLPIGEIPTAFSFSFQITSLRDHSNNDYQLNVYLLDSNEPTVTGTDLFHHGSNDPDHAFVGSHFIPSGANTDTITLGAPVNVTFTIDSGAALELLQSYYTGHVPDQEVAAFRFNLNQLFPLGDLTGFALNCYMLNNAVAQSGFKIQSLPGTFNNWIGGFGLVSSQQGMADDPDGDSLSNAIEAWFGTHPGEFSGSLRGIGSNGSTTTFTHSINPRAPSNITGYYQWSPNLTDWYHGNGAEGPAGGTTVRFDAETINQNAHVTVSPSRPMNRMFFRVGVITK
ncbi:MAG: glycosyl hydrolase family 28-related protein [Verrucomicrobiota bacterium]